MKVCFYGEIVSQTAIIWPSGYEHAKGSEHQVGSSDITTATALSHPAPLGPKRLSDTVAAQGQLKDSKNRVRIIIMHLAPVALLVRSQAQLHPACEHRFRPHGKPPLPTSYQQIMFALQLQGLW